MVSLSILVSRKQGFLLICLLTFFALCSIVISAVVITNSLVDRNQPVGRCSEEFNDNIGYYPSMNATCYPPVDAVYTWVNGSDPEWLKKMQYYRSIYYKEHNVADKESDTSTSINRFRDNDELKYSIRSLEVNAPWIRHIYIVTNGQIPDWLDLSNPKISIVTHDQIFYHPDALPTFSSPSIEMNLHHIPGLSDYFLYFNDDVFIGSPVKLSDFLSLEKGQRLFTSWVVPDCAERCHYNELGNGQCDQRCNVPQCGFDLGDCGTEAPPEPSTIQNAEHLAAMVGEEETCAEGCETALLGDGNCDALCNVPQCGLDLGDCETPNETPNETPSERIRPDVVLCYQVAGIPAVFKENETLIQFVYQRWDVTPESFCLLRLVIRKMFLEVDLSDYLKNMGVSLVVALEKEAVLVSKINPETKKLTILLKPSLADKEWELHLMIPVMNETPDQLSYLFFINLIHFPSANQITAFINKGIIPAVQNANPSAPSFGYFLAPGGVQTAVKFIIPDPWAGLPLGSVSSRDFAFTRSEKVSVAVGQFVNSNTVFNLSSPAVYSSFVSGFRQVIGIPETNVPPLLFSGTMFSQGILTLDVATPNSDLVMVHTLHMCTNYDHLGYMPFRAWLSRRKAFVGPEPDIRTHLDNYPHIRQMRTCVEAMQATVPEGSFISNSTVVMFWREIFEIYKLPNLDGIFLNAFSKSIKMDYFASLQELIQMEQYFDPNISLVIAVPSVEIVTCSWNLEKQAFFGKPEMEQFIPQNRADLEFKRAVIPFIRYDENRAVFRYGDIGAVIWLDAQFFQKHVKIMNRHSRNKNNLYFRNETPRRLSDSYRGSLVFTNLQLIRLFGNEKRSVPAHMPHLINKWVMREIESKLSQYVNSTIRHKFREDSDLQYAFLYFHYLNGLMKQEENRPLEIIWREKIDRNGNGILDANEFETLVAMVVGNVAGSEEKRELLQCLGIDATSPRESTYHDNHGSLNLHRSYISNITLESVINCEKTKENLIRRFPSRNSIDIVSDSDVAFQMIQDDLEDLQKQLDSVRKRKSKFVCINDNIRHKNESHDKIIHDFYNSFFPLPSQFEKNRGYLWASHYWKQVSFFIGKIHKSELFWVILFLFGLYLFLSFLG